MVTETVTVRFVERGGRVVKRRIDDIGVSADRATRGIFLLKRALFVIGGAGAISGFARYADALTNVENRLKLTTDSTAQLEAVQTQLFQSARNARSDFEATADVYNRIALSARNLGVGQRQILDVTETLQKAAILSGASAREANAALIQLGQGIASDRLSGDELRSVLEQLPAVADIIVDYLNTTQQFGEVTRGSLRSLGREGKLTADIVFRAIQASQQRVNDLFDQTNPTIEQAFNVAKTNLLEFIDVFDDVTGASEAVANAIITISENLGTIARVAATAAIALSLVWGVRAVQRVLTYVNALQRAGKVIGATILLEQRRAGRALVTAAAQARNTAATLAETVALTANGRARDAQTGRFITAAAGRTRLAIATNANAVAEASLTRAIGRTTAAQAAQTTVAARLAATYPTLAGGARLAANAVRAFTVAVAANPIGFVITAITTAIVLLITFGDRIKVLGSEFITLKDLGVAAFQVIVESVSRVATKIAGFFEPLFERVSPVFTGIRDIAVSSVMFILGIMKTSINSIIGLFVGGYRAIIAVWQNLGPAFKDFAAIAINGLIEIVERGVQGIINAFQSVLTFLGSAAELVGQENPFANLFSEDAINLDRFKATVTGAASATGAEAAAAFQEGFSQDFVGGAGGLANVVDSLTSDIVDRARRNATARGEDEAFSQGFVTNSLINDVDNSDQGKKGKGRTFAQELVDLGKQIELAKLYGLEKEKLNNILSVERAIKRDLTDTERELVNSATELLAISEIQGQVLEEINGPMETMRLTQEALNQLYEQGAISLDQYNSRLRETKIATLEASETFSGSFQASIMKATESVSDMGSALGDIVVGAAGSAADALVEFANTGKLNMKALFNQIFSDIAKLILKQLFLRALGFVFPGAAGGASFGPQPSLPQLAGGGSFTPTGPGSTDTQIVEFAKRPDERVDVLTPQQQAAQRNNLRNGMGGGDQPAPIVNQKVINVMDMSLVGQFLDTPEGETVLINKITASGILQNSGQ